MSWLLPLVLFFQTAPMPAPWAEVRAADFPAADPYVVLDHKAYFQLALDHDRACDARPGDVSPSAYSPFTEVGWLGKRQLRAPWRDWYPDVK